MTQVFPHGAIEITYPTKETFKVKEQRLKLYYRGDFDPKQATKNLQSEWDIKEGVKDTKEIQLCLSRLNEVAT